MKKTKTNGDVELGRPALTPEAQESAMISLAFQLVEKRLRDGSASSQETTHFLKLASSKARLEEEKLRLENQLVKAKTDQIQAQAHADEMYEKAINAFKRYSGHAEEEIIEE